jgi:hypothetical protein
MPRETFPAGIRTAIDMRIPLTGVLDQAGAVTFLLSYVMPFKALLERVEYIPDVTGAGAGATQALRVRKGNATGAIIATVTPTLANHVLGGPGLTGSVAPADINSGAALFKDNDTLSITKDAGTVFSAAGGTLRMVFWQRNQSRL